MCNGKLKFTSEIHLITNQTVQACVSYANTKGNGYFCAFEGLNDCSPTKILSLKDKYYACLTINVWVTNSGTLASTGARTEFNQV